MKNNDVYKITNKVTGKVYIGITNQGAGARYRHHWYEARTGEPAPIHRSMAKYGEKGYNLTEGGDGTFGRLHSEETKEKIRQKAIGRKASEETKKKMSEAQKKYKDMHKAHADAIRLLNQKAIVVYDLEGNIVEEFDTTKECAEKYNVTSTTVKYYCRSEQPKVIKKFNLIWRYKNAA